MRYEYSIMILKDELEVVLEFKKRNLIKNSTFYRECDIQDLQQAIERLKN